MLLIEMDQVIYRTGFTADEIRDLVNKEIFPSPFTIEPIQRWNINDVEKFCIVNTIKKR